MKILKKLAIFSCLPMMTLLYNCHSSNEQTDDSKDSSELVNIDQKQAFQIIFSLPAPVDIASALVDHPDSKFNRDILNPPENMVKYTTNRSIALNIGIYSSDLSYAGFFEQKQITHDYLVVTKKMAENIGIINSIDEESLKKLISPNIDKVAMQKIISESFMNTDAYLMENGRSEIMTMILIGGWIEAQYLATNLTKSSLTENPELVQRIMEQGLTLELMLNFFAQDMKNEQINALKKDLTEIKNSYDKLNQEMSPKNYSDFCTIIKKVRTSYTA